MTLVADSKPFVVAFIRDRDFYQVPLALYEHGLLDRLVTDTYCPDTLPGKKLFDIAHLAHRRTEGLPSKMVEWNYRALLWQVLGPKIGISPLRVHERIDTAISEAALSRAIDTDSNLFLYSYYAFEAFTSHTAKYKLKGLFKFHPDSKLIQEILFEDYAKHPECQWSIENEEDTSKDFIRYDRLVEEWRVANFIVCGSEFTARSLIHAGCEPGKISVVPYGIDPIRCPYHPEKKKSVVCRFLFVGQGVQRKGLHHLLKAWREAKLPGAELTIIASRCDPGIAALAGNNVRILDRQPTEALMESYNRSHVFVLPSLIEGFGLVFLEALAAGCFCIGTSNTGLPDLKPPPYAAKIVPAGDIAALTVALEQALVLHNRDELNSSAIRSFALTLSWRRFRGAIAKIVDNNILIFNRL